MNKLFARQVEKAHDETGAVDMERLGALVGAAYEAAQHDRRRTDRSIGLMIEELDQMTGRLEKLVAERTIALRAREADLEAQNLRFDAAINNMSQGLLMFDSAARLVICNRRYLEMYHLADGDVRPGASLLEIIALQVANGTLVGQPEELAENVLAAVATQRPAGWLNGLPDGRTISVRLHTTADGGWVTTHDDISDRRDAEKRIAHMARHDALTDLPNRAAISERLEELAEHIRRGERLAVLYLDLDEFKSVNDTLGHAVGDDLLRAVAERLRGCLREQDAVARVSGDEFVVVQTGVTHGAAESAALAARICETLRAPFRLGSIDVVVETSIGVSIAPDDGGNAADLLKNAGIALHRAKGEGRGTIRFFEPSMDDRMKERRALEVALRVALAAGDFELHYQPLVNLADGRVTACEALIRWQTPEGERVGPEEFIPVAEEMGLVVPIGEWVIRQACADAATWPEGVRVAVNLSPIQLTNPRLVPVVVGALAASSLPASRLELEVTETVLMQNTETTLSTLRRLHGLGVRISMDDFGTGYSSLSNLRSFPFDKIKIDRSFVGGLPGRTDSLAIVRAVAGLARNLNMVTTAEGVETAAQMELVRQAGCTEMQGYYFSRPLPIDQINSLLANHAARSARTA